MIVHENVLGLLSLSIVCSQFSRPRSRKTVRALLGTQCPWKNLRAYFGVKWRLSFIHYYLLTSYNPFPNFRLDWFLIC